MEGAKQQLGPTGADNPQVRETLVRPEKARFDLLRTRVIAPSDGVVANLERTIGQVVGPGQPAMTFIDAGTIWIDADFKENSLQFMTAGDPAEIVLDALRGMTLAAEVESIGWGVSRGSSDPVTGLPTIWNPKGWICAPQHFPVRPNFKGQRLKDVRFAAQANFVVYASDNPILPSIGHFWIRMVSCLTNDALSAAAAEPITVASLVGQLDPVRRPVAVVGLMLVNLLGGSVASLAFTVCAIRPSALSLFTVVLIVAPIFAGKAMADRSKAPVCLGGPTNVFILFGLGVSPLPGSAAESFSNCVGFVLFAIVCGVVFAALLWRPKDRLAALFAWTPPNAATWLAPLRAMVNVDGLRLRVPTSRAGKGELP
ncbi:MAG: HlyD family secretion protein [Gemmobacter sp.]